MGRNGWVEYGGGEEWVEFKVGRGSHVPCISAPVLGGEQSGFAPSPHAAVGTWTSAGRVGPRSREGGTRVKGRWGQGQGRVGSGREEGRVRGGLANSSA